MRLRLASPAVLLLLVACGQADTGQAPAAAQPAVQAALTSPPLDATGVPRLRPGLWEVTKTDEGQTETSMDCMGPEADKEVRDLLTRETPDCKVERSSGVGGLRLKADCLQSGVKIQSEFVMTGSDTAYDMRLGVYVVNPDGEREGGEMTAKARWVGACPAGVQPGESVEP